MKVRYLEEQITPECLSKNSLNIDLDGHNVNIQEIQRIASALQKCLNLKMLRLNLDNNLIREEGAFFLGQGLSSCTNLQMLMIGLRFNKIGPQGILNLGLTQTVCQNLNKLVLDLIDNNLGDQGLQNICPILESCSNLKVLKLQLGQNKIKNKGIIELASCLTKCTQLKELNILFPDNQINIGSEELPHLCNSISQWKQIQNLTLGFSQFQNICFSDLGSTLACCIQLQDLNIILGKKNVLPQDIHAFLSQLQKSNSISKFIFDLDNSQSDRLHELDLHSLFDGFKKLTFLTLFLSQNKLGAEGISKIVSSLANCQNLITLKIDLSSYGLKKIKAQNIISALVKFSDLQALVLYGGLGITISQMNRLLKLKKLTNVVFFTNSYFPSHFREYF
ncbi:hypothetical protein ABPG74_000368 [Tetrahymena malaccensis]